MVAYADPYIDNGSSWDVSASWRPLSRRRMDAVNQLLRIHQRRRSCSLGVDAGIHAEANSVVEHAQPVADEEHDRPDRSKYRNGLIGDLRTRLTGRTHPAIVLRPLFLKHSLRMHDREAPGVPA